MSEDKAIHTLYEKLRSVSTGKNIRARYITMMIGIVLTESERRVSDGR